MKNLIAATGALALSVVATQALAEGDAAAGESVFRKCQACHVVDQEQNRVGPHLVGIINRPVASVDGFKYSNAMQEYAGTQATWTAEALTAYLADPRGVVKGTRMAFAGLKKEQEVADVIAFLTEKAGVTE